METVELSLNSSTLGPRYLIPETMYEHNHPLVLHYTEYFTERAARKDVFSRIDAVLEQKGSSISAEKVADLWYEFSRFVPSFIARAVSLTTDPEQQHHLIQIAYDELGGQDKKFIHSRLFLDALEHANINPGKSTSPAITKILSVLNNTLEQTKSSSGIIGLLLSFEIIAEKNIETVFHGLSANNSSKDKLSASHFFKIHRSDEVEHIRHSVANFLRFSKSDEDIEEAEHFFDAGIDFWKNFWNQIAELIVVEDEVLETV